MAGLAACRWKWSQSEHNSLLFHDLIQLYNNTIRLLSWRTCSISNTSITLTSLTGSYFTHFCGLFHLLHWLNRCSDCYTHTEVSVSCTEAEVIFSTRKVTLYDSVWQIGRCKCQCIFYDEYEGSHKIFGWLHDFIKKRWFEQLICMIIMQLLILALVSVIGSVFKRQWQL